MFDRDILIYGTGGCASNALKLNDVRERTVAVLTGELSAHGGVLSGVPICYDDRLNEMTEPFDLIIASQYFETILARLKAAGKLENTHLKGIYVPNLLERPVPYPSDPPAVIAEEEWAWLETALEEESRELLSHIRRERSKPTYPSEELSFCLYEEGRFHAGSEDYWHSVAGVRSRETTVVIEAGAYIGDTVELIAGNVGGRIHKYYAMEPVAENFDQLKKLSFEMIDQFIPLQAALGEKPSTVYFSVNYDKMDSGSVAQQDEHTVPVQCVSLDSMALTEDADYFVKMDIEGSELAALKGGVRFIREKRPNLAICLYHKERDLFEIPRFLKSIVPDYRLYLAGGSHTILIAQ